MRAKPIAYDDDSAPPSDGPAKPVVTSAGLGRRVGAFLLHELREILPPTIFFFVGFNLIVLTTNLILADYLVAFGNFMLATAAALVVGKAVLVTNALPFLRRYDRAPLIQPILFKTAVYWAVVLIARLLEHFVRFWLIEHNPPGDFLSHMMATFSWHRFAAIQLWIIGAVPDLCDGVRAQSPVRRGRAAAPLVHPSAVRTAAQPTPTHPRARPPEPARRRPLGRRVPRSNQHRASSISRDRTAARPVNRERVRPTPVQITGAGPAILCPKVAALASRVDSLVK